MAAQVSAGDIIRATVRLSHPIMSAIENVWHFRCDGAGTAAGEDALSAVHKFMQDVYNTWDAIMSEDTTLVDIIVNTLLFVQDHWTTGLAVGVINDITDFLPVSAAEVMPPSNAHLLRFRTDFPKHEGRKYFAPFTEAQSIAGLVNQATIDLGNIVYLNTLLYSDAIPNSALTLDHIVLDANQELYNIPETGIQSNRWSVQRRRKRYVGL